MELEKSIEVAANKLSLHGNNISKESKELVLTYILDRLNAYYKEKGFNPKSYKSVAALKLTNLYDIDLRTKAMENPEPNTSIHCQIFKPTFGSGN